MNFNLIGLRKFKIESAVIIALIACSSLVSTDPAHAGGVTTDFTFPCNTGTYTVQYSGSFGPTETPTTGGTLTAGGSCDGEFSVDSSVTSIGYSAFSGNTAIRKVNFPEGLRSFAEAAFGSTQIKEVTLPSSVTSIGTSSFIYVSSIETFTTYSTMSLPAGFLADNALKSISILSNMVTITDWAFARSTYLTSITLPASLREIGNHVFSNVYSLKTITFPASLQSIGANVFSYAPVETFTTYSSMAIGEYSFLKGSTLRNVQILGNVETIGSNAFDSATALSTVTLPASLKTIGSEAFKNARSLTSITIPSGLLNIEANSFDIERFTSLTYNGSNSSILLTLQTFMAPGYFVNGIDPAIAIRAAEAKARAEAAAKEAAAKARAEAEAKAAQEKAKALAILQKHVTADDIIYIDYIIEDFAAPPIIKPTIDTYKAAGVPGVTNKNLLLVNDLVDNIKLQELNITTMCDAVKIANIVIDISQITIYSKKIIKQSEMKILLIDDIAPRELHVFTNYLADCPSVERDTPAELEAAAKKFKIYQAEEKLKMEKIREAARADLLAKIAAAFSN